MSSVRCKKINVLIPSIGGAERLIVDAAVGLQNLGHIVTVYTSHCDPNHCFEEVKDGVYQIVS